MELDFNNLVFPGKHQAIFAPNGAVATSQPLAAQAGLAVLQRGGNALDAALATAIALTVVEPTSNGIGGDVCAVVWDGERLHGLNGSGRAPEALTAEAVRSAGHTEMPDAGWFTVTVPGAPAAWRDLHDRFGSVPFSELFAPAIAYAERGYPISPISCWNWRWAIEQVFPTLTGPEFAELPSIFAPLGHPPRAGDWWRCPELVWSLRRIAETGAEDFYHGELAERMSAFAARTGGFLTTGDLAAHASTWVNPISTRYRGYDVWEIPPNAQGLATLLALNLLEDFDLGMLPRESADAYHTQIEAMKLAFADAHRYIADPERHDVPVAGLLARDYATSRRTLIGQEALDPEAGEPSRGDTVYLCAGDSQGMMVSFIQSTYDSFGSHVVVPGTGIALQNRGACFSLDPAHPNVLAPGKRPYHTLMPGFLTRDGQPMGPFGVMGGHMQPQGHVQVVVNTVDFAMDPQTSLDAPRWSVWGGRSVKLEPRAARLADDLRRRGHEVEIDEEVDWAGRGQIIWRLPAGGYVAGSDIRSDGQVAGY
jgi:gamma-glutamyltranspeptidase/glutathione hydrolase